MLVFRRQKNIWSILCIVTPFSGRLLLRARKGMFRPGTWKQMPFPEGSTGATKKKIGKRRDMESFLLR
jgi:hypothetical protein